MATADPTPDDELEDCEEYRDQREILSVCFSEARQRLDEREQELCVQLKSKFRENMNQRKVNYSDIQQLMSAMEQLKSTLLSKSTCQSENSEIGIIQGEITKLEAAEMGMKLNWFPEKLFDEIKNIGEYSLLPASQVLLHTFRQQKREIKSLLSQKLLVGQSWYLIHVKWFNQWKKYVGYDDKDRDHAGDEHLKPGPIDNTPLLDVGRLKKLLSPEVDYKLVPEGAWHKLVYCYGTTEGSDEVKRHVVLYTKNVQRCKVEVYPLELKAVLYPREKEFTIVSISRSDTIQSLFDKVREIYNIADDVETRIYRKEMGSCYEIITFLTQEAQNVGLLDGECVLLEVQNEDRTWPMPVKLLKKKK